MVTLIILHRKYASRAALLFLSLCAHLIEKLLVRPRRYALKNYDAYRWRHQEISQMSKHARTTITVPADLKARMDSVEESINWSALACEEPRTCNK